METPTPVHVPPRGRSAGPTSILGASPPIAALRRDIVRIGDSGATTVLIHGETGTGKELVARAIHDCGPRAAGPYIVVNCSAVPAALLEGEFMGHEAGAFTDARKRRAGLLEAADGGTLFLDEVGELEPVLQAKFLRFLEDGRVRRLGGSEDLRVDVRFVAATNADLEELVARERFRRDLFYRLQVVTLRVPPLRERPGDVPLLAEHFLRLYAARFHKAFSGFTPAALECLTAHPWPGNVRELRNVVERVVLLEEGPLVDAPHLVLGSRKAGRAGAPDLGPVEDLDLEHVELRTLVRALERGRGNLTHAAKLLGISRDAVRYRMRKLGVRLETRVVVEHGRSA